MPKHKTKTMISQRTAAMPSCALPETFWVGRNLFTIMLVRPNISSGRRCIRSGFLYISLESQPVSSGLRPVSWTTACQ